jgi:GNAT superfamily N-acetyltransferase
MNSTLHPPPEATPAKALPRIEYRVFDRTSGLEATAQFAAMTYPSLRALLAGQDPAAHPVAIGALLDGEPAGLALGGLPATDQRLPGLVSLFVAPAQRNRGIGAELLARFEREMAARGCAEIETVFTSNKPGAVEFAAVLAKRHWPTPEMRMLLIKLDIHSLRKAHWFQRTPLPPDEEIIRWRDVTEAEREDLRAQQREEGWIAKDLVPFDHEAGCCLHTSMALRKNGRIAGWMICHLIDAVHQRYTCGYTRPELQRLGRYIQLMVAASEPLCTPEYPASVPIYTVPAWHPRMVRFADRRMVPHSLFRGETMGSRKLLRP